MLIAPLLNLILPFDDRSFHPYLANGRLDLLHYLAKGLLVHMTAAAEESNPFQDGW